ncbi:MAG: hypothetical protein K8J08_11130 [Thermoanaerobaculia bacterium]|nr:hypothetical protein [Thermoanaerobaculia bacterium]
MRFMSYDWWHSGDVDDVEPIDEYWKHIDAIEKYLPTEVRRLLGKEFTLHDGVVSGLSLDVDSQVAKLSVLGFDGRLEASLVYEIEYSEVARLELVPRQAEEPEIEWPTEGSLGQIGYDEFDLVSEGQLEHRILFTSGAELVVHFGRFSFQAQT